MDCSGSENPAPGSNEAMKAYSFPHISSLAFFSMWADAAAALVDARPTMGIDVGPRDNCGVPFPKAHEKGEELLAADWAQLEEGHYVIVQRDSEPAVSGEVDVVTQDASVFWVWLDGGRGRIAVYGDEGFRVWLPQGYRL
ncbi:hypothetical protein NicSoilB11_42570 (plasmid) [Arthrobacter sp. NicSoilB11]|nr:hypothetical protein NicSoilB11_42570 [Arthrobacter sp. NicSoilB11]GIU57999.1 hypothetical protein NicSoilC12_37480 [Arthrobacter sp. NicSoilC12]VXB97820.1 hypothetical protein ARTHRO8AJ_40185 [Arthrobacter sp. 8AJ]